MNEIDSNVAPFLSESGIDFKVVAGRVYQLRLVLQRQASGEMREELSWTHIDFSFFNKEGRRLDPRLETGNPVIPLPKMVPVWPSELIDVASDAVACNSLFMLASPDAHVLRIRGWTSDLLLREAQLVEIPIASHIERESFIRFHAEELQRGEKNLRATLELQGTDNAEMKAWFAFPGCQIDSLREYFTVGGDWQPVLDGLGDPASRLDHQQRLERVHEQANDLPRAGFIGSERGFERMEATARTFWLREGEYRDQLVHLRLDVIVIETVPESGAIREASDWQLAFSSLTGEIPDRGAALFDAAAAAGIAIHLWATGSGDLTPLWLEAARRADRVIAEGVQEDWSLLAPDYILPRASEPAACSLASLERRPCDLMLVPAASDIFQFPDFADIVDAAGLYAVAVTEFRYNFDFGALTGRLTNRELQLLGRQGRAGQRRLLQAARIVLLPARSLRGEAALVEMAMDAILSGAIPVLYGKPTGREPLLLRLDQVHSIAALAELQALYRINWYADRRWGDLFLRVMREAVWTGKDREALLGRDPFGTELDRPRVSAILVTKRPHLLAACLETFRNQTWPDKELILICNTGNWPNALPKLRPNERAFVLPEHVNIGECLNRGIEASGGRLWAKIDDDDFYTPTYLEELVYYYRSSQSDVVGRQAVHYYFEADNITRSYDVVARQRAHKMQRVTDHISGATLSGNRSSVLPLFSMADRNACDSNWVKLILMGGYRVYGGNTTSMIVYRGADESGHTWKISAAGGLVDGMAVRMDGNLLDMIEKSVQGRLDADDEC